MSATKEFTYSDVSEHTSKKDLYVVIHDKVYNASSFVDEHPWVLHIFPTAIQAPPLGSWMVRPSMAHRPGSIGDWHPMCRGGEEVMLDVGGQDATEAFEDVGHSDEARDILNGLLIGNLKRQVIHSSPPFLSNLVRPSSTQEHPHWQQLDHANRKVIPPPKHPPPPPPPQPQTPTPAVSA
jgi:cytochrome b involved in lipid metabolism